MWDRTQDVNAFCSSKRIVVVHVQQYAVNTILILSGLVMDYLGVGATDRRLI